MVYPSFAVLYAIVGLNVPGADTVPVTARVGLNRSRGSQLRGQIQSIPELSARWTQLATERQQSVND